jgi:uncharacterized protein (DUF1330 family)
MKGYLIANVDVTDPEGYVAYRLRTPEIIARYGGRFLVRGGEVTPLEGEMKAGRLVILEFDSVEAAKAFYHSPDYQEIIPIRTGASTGDFVIVEGFDG